MWTIAQVSAVLQTPLTTTANALARESGFVQRASKLTGAHFVQAVLFGWLNAPQATLQSLAQMAGTVGVSISPQAEVGPGVRLFAYRGVAQKSRT